MHPHSLLYLLCCCKANLGMDLQKFKEKSNKKEKKNLVHYFLGALEVTALAWMLHLKFEHSLINWEEATADLKSYGALNGRSHHNKQTYLISDMGLCLSFSFTAICVSPPTHSTSNPTQSKCFLLLWCWYTIVEEEHQNISHHRQGWHWQWTKTNWGEMIMGTDFFGNWCDRLHYWVNRSMKHSRLAWNEKL